MANRNKNKRISRTPAEVPSHAESAKRSGSPPIFRINVSGIIIENETVTAESKFVTADIKLPLTLAECALKIAEAAFSIADELCYKNGVLLKKDISGIGSTGTEE